MTRRVFSPEERAVYPFEVTGERSEHAHAEANRAARWIARERHVRSTYVLNQSEDAWLREASRCAGYQEALSEVGRPPTHTLATLVTRGGLS